MSLSSEFAADEIVSGAAVRPAAPGARLKIPVVPEKVSGEQWDKIAAGFDGICQEQLHAFAAMRWPGTELEPVLFRLDGEPVGGVLMMVQKLPLGLGAIAVAKWAPVLADAGRADSHVIYAAMIEALAEEFARKRAMMISIMPRAENGSRNRAHDYLELRGFRAGSRLQFPNRYVVNLGLDDDAQRKSFSQKWRYHLKRSEKAELVFEHAGAERFGEFDELYKVMSERKRFPDHSAYDTVEKLMVLENPALRPEMFFVRHAGQTVAGAVVFKAGDVAVYLYGATCNRALPLRAGYFLHWHIIRWLRDNTGAGWYDLGGTDGFKGLHQFKKGMVGTAGYIAPVPPVMNYAASRTKFMLGSTAFAARDGLNRAKDFLGWLRRDMARPDQER